MATVGDGHEVSVRLDHDGQGLLKDKISVMQCGDRFKLKRTKDVVTFDKALFLCFRATQLLRRMNSDADCDVVVVGVAGASGAGKTCFAQKLKSLIPDSTVLSMDNYMKREEVVDDNFDDPRLVDFDMMVKNLEELHAGKSTEMPVYSFAESRRTGFTTVTAPKSGVIIVEGIHALNVRVRALFDVTVSISGGVHFDLVKRIMRDTTRVGQNGSEAINQVTETVYPMYKIYIEPDMEHAHIRAENDFNPFLGFKEPMYMLKSAKCPSAEDVVGKLGEPESKEEKVYTDLYLHPPGQTKEDAMDWIRLREEGKQYHLMFSEWLIDGDFIITPRLEFAVNVKVLGGLMALGYEIGFVMRRTSRILKYANGVHVTLGNISGLGFVQIKGTDRAAVDASGTTLGLAGSYDARSYIEMVKDIAAESGQPLGVDDLDAIIKRAHGSATQSPSTSRNGTPSLTPHASPMLRGVDGHSNVEDGNDVSFSLDTHGHTAEPKGLVKNMLEVVQRGDDFKLKKLAEVVTFDKGLFLAFRATQLLRRVNNNRVIVVGVAGASGSGKTHFCSRLTSLVTGSTILTMDNYMKREEVVDDNFDDPRLVDFPLLVKNLNELRQGKSTEVPIYSFAESRRTGYTTVNAPESGVVIIEGIHALNSQARKMLDIAVSVSGGIHYDLVKRVHRDISRVGQTGSEVINQVTETVYPMYKAYIEPALQFAHIKVENKFNPFDGFMTPVYILKSTKTIDDAAVTAALGAPLGEVLEETYTDVFLHPPMTSVHDNIEWIRMREHDKQYHLMFSEWLREGDFIICPRIDFEVNVKVLGGLMTLGYEIGFVMRRTSRVFKFEGGVTVTLDKLSTGSSFTQVKGGDRSAVAAAATKLGLDGNYDARSYIEMVDASQLHSVSADDPTVSHEIRSLLKQAAKSPSRHNVLDWGAMSPSKQPTAVANAEGMANLGASLGASGSRFLGSSARSSGHPTPARSAGAGGVDPHSTLPSSVAGLQQLVLEERSARMALEHRLELIERLLVSQHETQLMVQDLHKHLIKKGGK